MPKNKTKDNRRKIKIDKRQITTLQCYRHKQKQPTAEKARTPQHDTCNMDSTLCRFSRNDHSFGLWHWCVILYVLSVFVVIPFLPFFFARLIMCWNPNQSSLHYWTSSIISAIRSCLRRRPTSSNLWLCHSTPTCSHVCKATTY